MGLSTLETWQAYEEHAVHRFLLPLLHFFNDGYQAALPLLLPFIAQDIGLSLTSIGFLGSMLSFASVVLALPAGMLAARFGARRLLHVAVGIYALAYLLVSQALSFPVLLGSIVLASLGFGIFHPVAFCAVARAGKGPSSLGMAMGTFTATGDIGRIALAATITVLVVAFGWSLTAIIYGAGALLLFLALFKFDNSEPVAAVSTGRSGRHLAVLKNPRFILANACSVLDSMASSSIFLFLPFLLVYRGIDYALLGTFSGAFFIGNLLGKTVLGYLVDKTGSTRIFVGAEVLMALSLVGLALAEGLAMIMVMALVLGLLTKGTVPITATMVAQSVLPTCDYESAYSVNSFTVGISSTLTPLGLGLVADAFGIQAVFMVCAVLALVATLPLVAVGLSSRRKS